MITAPVDHSALKRRHDSLCRLLADPEARRPGGASAPATDAEFGVLDRLYEIEQEIISENQI